MTGFAFTSDPAELIRRALAAGIPVYWIEPGRVTDPEGYNGRAALGAVEYQFSDGPAGLRSTSADFLTLSLRDSRPSARPFTFPRLIWGPWGPLGRPSGLI